jgi:hypothetical protein
MATLTRLSGRQELERRGVFRLVKRWGKHLTDRIGVCLEANNPALERCYHGIGAIVDSQFFQNMIDMKLGRALANAQLGSNFPIALIPIS